MIVFAISRVKTELLAGETEFVDLGLRIKPKKGAALLWANVKSGDPTQLERASLHAGREVMHGTKIAANMWMYQYDYRTVWSCAWHRDLVHGKLGYDTPPSQYRI